MEPLSKTYEKVGQLCVAWSYLEMLTERTLWGILGLNDMLAEAFVWRMQLTSKWQAIKREGKKTLPEAEYLALKALAKAVESCARDRNIVVHGLVHAIAVVNGPIPTKGTIIGTTTNPPPFSVEPCWTIFMGEDAGKNFPISHSAVELIIQNVQKLCGELEDFNLAHNYVDSATRGLLVEKGWPKPL